MPYYHCRACQHEFESVDPQNVAVCDWCTADQPHILEYTTPLEKMLGEETLTNKILSKMTVVKVESSNWKKWPKKAFGKKVLEKLKKHIDDLIIKIK